MYEHKTLSVNVGGEILHGFGNWDVQASARTEVVDGGVSMATPVRITDEWKSYEVLI